MSHLLEDEFEDFFQKIQLTQTQASRIESAVDALTGYLIKEYEISPEDVFVQGSFSTSTVVRPAPSLKNGEYDVDVVIQCAAQGDTPNKALNDLEAIIEAHGTYKDKIDKENPKIPCVRLRYADEDKAKFHVDLVPAKKNGDGTIEVPRRDEDWEVSNPVAYTSWVISQGDRYQRTLMMFKRWRDETEAPIKSIVLQVLVAECLGDATTDVVSITETFRAMSTLLESHQSPPDLRNPVLDDEELTSRWNTADFLKFKEAIDDAADLTTTALDEQEHDEAAQIWQKVLGEDFVYTTDKEVSLGLTQASLGDISHVKPLIFPYNPMVVVSTNIRAYFYKPWTRSVYMPRKRRHVQVVIGKARHEIKSGQVVRSGGHLDYYANVHGLRGRDYEIHWQVVNTGDEATQKSGLRGTFFASKDTNNLKYNYEQTSYEGTHWIECFVILDGVCVARSGRFYLNIKH